jgi:hypothetical protein
MPSPRSSAGLRRLVPLYTVTVRDCFGARIMGRVFGATTMASCVGMAA